MTAFLDRLGIEVPVVQAGMGGGLAGTALAVAVSEAGGLGTLGHADPKVLSAKLAEARRRTSKPLAVNLLLPFARAAHWKAASGADVVVTFWGVPRRGSPGTWVHQVGSVDEARAAVDAGADAVIVQGVEAGGHVRGVTPALELMDRVRNAVPSGYPLLLAGGIATAEDVSEALAAGAVAAVSGTRFLMSEESGASAAYKQRLVDGDETILTELFGLGWPGAHRVLPNAATDRWLRGDVRGPKVVRAANRVTRRALTRVPGSVQARMARHQVVAVPFLSPVPPGRDASEAMLETAPLYAGETVARIDDISPALQVLASLVPSAW